MGKHQIHVFMDIVYFVIFASSPILHNEIRVVRMPKNIKLYQADFLCISC